MWVVGTGARLSTFPVCSPEARAPLVECVSVVVTGVVVVVVVVEVTVVLVAVAGAAGVAAAPVVPAAGVPAAGVPAAGVPIAGSVPMGAIAPAAPLAAAAPHTESIVESIANEHDGTVTAANADDGGAVFTLQLPLGDGPDDRSDPGL